MGLMTDVSPSSHSHKLDPCFEYGLMPCEKICEMKMSMREGGELAGWMESRKLEGQGEAGVCVHGLVARHCMTKRVVITKVRLIGSIH